jgi:hypothetical protein
MSVLGIILLTLVIVVVVGGIVVTLVLVLNLDGDANVADGGSGGSGDGSGNGGAGGSGSDGGGGDSVVGEVGTGDGGSGTGSGSGAAGVVVTPDCVVDVDCSDGLICTQDKCEGEKCIHVPKNNLCLDGQICSLTQGCIGTPTTVCVNMCGNGVCQEVVCLGSGCPCAETIYSCYADCNVTGVGGSCGDGNCSSWENSNNCVADCPIISGDVCGDGDCTGSETESSCAADCRQIGFCGDTNCDEGEDSNSCPADCGPVVLSTEPNLKVAMIGDTGAGGDFRSVLNLIKNEGADLVMHQGDFAYDGSDISGWEAAVNSILGPDFPYFGSVGNHDSGWSGGYGQALSARAQRVGAECTGNYGIESTCKFKGLTMLLVKGDSGGPAGYITQQLAQDEAIWRVCSWHWVMEKLNLCTKGDDSDYAIYEACKNGGAIITTGHEHSYARTVTFTNTETQSIDSSCLDNPSTPNKDVCVDEGRTFVIQSGSGGRSLRDDCNKGFSYWGATDNTDFGALFISFNVDGDPRKARGYYKTVDGNIHDEFEITNSVNLGVSASPVDKGLWGRVVDFFRGIFVRKS